MSAAFNQRLLAWFDRHGRRDLPWQQDPTPYRVWVSEIMLQQTQVATVIPYYLRFMARFPNVTALADAPLDDVLHLWSGLGYYARARHLHKAARVVRDQHQGRYPEEREALQGLPGIGRSTAGAILAFACGQRHPILDGNVKRVLCRHHAIDGWPGHSGASRELWTLSEHYTPLQRVADYTQAIMDLGATVCTRARPRCGACPLASDCAAYGQGMETDYPRARPRRTLPVRAVVFVMLRRAGGELLLERRPPVGVWGGLWSFPECPPEVPVEEWCQQRLARIPREVRYLSPLRHTFSHFHLDITPALVRVEDPGVGVLDGDGTLWYNPTRPGARGLPAPVTRLMALLTENDQGKYP